MNLPSISPERSRGIVDLARSLGDRLEAARRSKRPAAQHADEARKAARMLEGLFLRQLMKVMRQSVPDGGLWENGNGSQIFNEMFDGAIADEVTQCTGSRCPGSRAAGGIGLADELWRQLNADTTAAAPAWNPVAPRGVAPVALPRTVVAKQAVARMQEVQRAGRDLNGVPFESPGRPEPVMLEDKDGRLASPLGGQLAHIGDDGTMPAAAGSTVVAVGSGRVAEVGADYVVVTHAGGLRSHYSMLGRVLAQPGDLVLRGQVLGKVGSAAMLGFGMQRDGRDIQGTGIMELMK